MVIVLCKIAFGSIALGDVANIKRFFGRQQLQRLELGELLFADFAGDIAASMQNPERLLHERQELFGFFVRPARSFFERGMSALEIVNVGEHQFGFHRLNVGDRINAAFNMGDVVIVKAARDMDERVHLADVAEKLIAQPFAFGGTAHEAGNVDEVDRGGDLFCGLFDLRQPQKARIGDGNLADIGLDGAEGVVFGLRVCGERQRVEEGRFADIGQPDDSTRKSHNFSFNFFLIVFTLFFTLALFFEAAAHNFVDMLNFEISPPHQISQETKSR